MSYISGVLVLFFGYDIWLPWLEEGRFELIPFSLAQIRTGKLQFVFFLLTIAVGVAASTQ